MEHLVQTHHESQCGLRDAFQHIQLHRRIHGLSYLVNAKHVELTATNQTSTSLERKAQNEINI